MRGLRHGYRSTPCALLLHVVVLGAGCADDDAVPDAALPDAAPEVDSAPPPIVAPEVNSPEPPALPEWDCPDGWDMVAVGSHQACEPWPNTFDGCPDGEVRFVGDRECAPWGTTCPMWPTDLPGGTIYVDANFVDGDGTQARPLATIAAALAQATAGATIAVAPGLYDEVLVIEKSVSIVGACVDGVEIRPSSEAEPDMWLSSPAIEIAAAGVTLRDVQIGGRRAGARVSAPDFTMERVLISHTLAAGLVVRSGVSAQVRELIVRDVRAPNGEATAGIIVAGSQSLELERVIVDDFDVTGIAILDESNVTIRDLLVRGGKDVESVSGDDGVGMFATSEDRETHVALSRVIFEENQTGHLVTTGSAFVDAEDVVMRDASPALDGLVVGGAHATMASSITLSRAYIAGSPSTLATSSSNALLTLHDFVGGYGGFGETESVALIFSSGDGVVDRAFITNQIGGGIQVDNGSRVTLSDVTVEHMMPLRDGTRGRALMVLERGEVEVQRLRATDVVESALSLFHRGSLVEGSDVDISEVRSQGETGQAGRGITVAEGARLDLTRVRVRRAREAGLLAFGSRTHVALSHARIEESLPRECEQTTCAGFGGGSGLAIVDEAHLDMVDFDVSHHVLAGVQLARRATAMMRSGVVSHNAVGVNLQEVNVDLEDLSEGVIFRDNAINLDSSALPVPNPVGAGN